jgi:hypothetical protein
MKEDGVEEDLNLIGEKKEYVRNGLWVGEWFI